MPVPDEANGRGRHAVTKRLVESLDWVNIDAVTGKAGDRVIGE